MEKAKKYCKGLLTKRKREKGLEYTPTEVELRTLLVPPISYYQIIFEDYYKLCEEIGLKNKLSQIPDTQKDGELKVRGRI